MEPVISFRKALPADIPVIRDLASRIWRQHYPGIISHQQIDYMLERMYADEVIRHEIEQQGYSYVLVLHGNVPAGFLSHLFERSGQSVKISKIYLLPELHGQGIGRKMLQYVKEDARARGAKRVYLFVNKMNVRAIRAYQGFGMKKAAELVTDIGNGFVMDDYRMELDLRAQ